MIDEYVNMIHNDDIKPISFTLGEPLRTLVISNHIDRTYP